MDLFTCKNCLTVYGTSQDECPSCRADLDGDGAEVEFDSATRTAIAHLGGLYGGILRGPDDSHLLWCARGVCLVDGAIGLAWSARAPGQVDDVKLTGDTVHVINAARSLVLDVADGNERE